MEQGTPIFWPKLRRQGRPGLFPAYHAARLLLNACASSYSCRVCWRADQRQSDPRFLSTLKRILLTPERGGLTSNVRLSLIRTVRSFHVNSTGIGVSIRRLESR